MKTYHVGGLNPLRRFSTLGEAILKAKDDDVIHVHKNISETVTINKNIIIKGNNHILTVPQGKMGIHTEKPLEVYDLKLHMMPRANGIVTQSNLHLENVEVKIIGPNREMYPTIMVSGASKVYMEKCRLMSITLMEDVSGEIVDTVFQSYYKGHISLATSEDKSSLKGNVMLTDCVLRSVVISGTCVIRDCEIDKYVDIYGHSQLINPCFNIQNETVKKNKYKNEPKNGPLSRQNNNRYGLMLTNNAEVIIKNYKVEHVSENYLGIYANNAVVTVEDTHNDTEQITHKIDDTTLSFKDTKDKNYWAITGGTVAYVRSTINSNNEHETATQKLDAMIGLADVKQQIKSIMNTIEMNRGNTDKNFDFSYNMIFSGSPGTGKTTIAEIVAEALFEIGAIPQNKFTEATSDEFVKGYVGQTGENTRKILDKALGGVLFIDEAYELTVKDNENSFNSEVISVLIRYMETHRNDLVVIAAGYTKEMNEFLSSNPGLVRRFQIIEFQDYTNQELAEIFEKIRSSYGDEYANEGLKDLIIPLFHKLTTLNLSIPDSKGRITNGGNGGLVRNVYQQIIQARNNRCVDQNDNSAQNMRLTQQDILIGFKVELDKAEKRRIQT